MTIQLHISRENVIYIFFFLQTKWLISSRHLQTCTSVALFLLSPPSRNIPFIVQSFDNLLIQKKFEIEKISLSALSVVI